MILVTYPSTAFGDDLIWLVDWKERREIYRCMTDKMIDINRKLGVNLALTTRHFDQSTLPIDLPYGLVLTLLLLSTLILKP